MQRIGFANLLTLLYAGLNCLAQEQSFSFGPPQGTLNITSAELTRNAKLTRAEAAQALVQAGISGGKDFYCMIHVVRWKDGKAEVDKQNWYLHHQGDGWSDTQFTADRLFGSKNVGLLYIHANAMGASVDEVVRVLAGLEADRIADQRIARTYRTDSGWDYAKLAERRYQLDVDAGAPRIADETALSTRLAAIAASLKDDDELNTLISDLRPFFLSGRDRSEAQTFANRIRGLREGTELIDGVVPGWKLGSVLSTNGRTLVRVGASFVEAEYTKVGYRVDVTAKLPQPILDLSSLIFMAQAKETGNAIPVAPMVLWGGGTMDVAHVPSDLKVTGSISVDGKSVEIGNKTFDNESKYFWDISAAIPLKSIKQTNFDATAQTLTPKEISRQSLFAVANIFPMRIDTKAKRTGIVPVILVGMGIDKKPLDRLLFAGGIGINQIQFFVGTAYTNKQFPGATAGTTVSARRTNLIFGLNVPIRQVVQKLKAAK